MVPAVFISFLVTGNAVPQLGFGATDTEGVYLLDKLDGLHRELGFHEYTSGSKSMFDVFLYYHGSDGRYRRTATRNCTLFYR